MSTTARRRRPLVLTLLCAVAIWLVPVASAPAGVVSLADTLGAAGTGGRIAEPQGYELAFDQSVGLRFEVTRPTLLLEVGGYVQDPFSFPAPGGVNVEVHPARPSGVPDRDVVVASARLSRRSLPGFVVFQRARLATLLRPGTYFALFAVPDQTPPASSNALLVGSGRLRTARGALVPYAAPEAPGGVTHPDSYDPSVRELQIPVQAAARVVGIALPRW